jgi:nickel/cobalt transporter (NicO) family protein
MVGILWRYRLRIVMFLTALLISFGFASPSYSHWADLSVAQVIVEPKATQISLTFPTGLLAFADDNKDNQLSIDELKIHHNQLESFLNQKIRLSDRNNQIPILKISPSDPSNLPSSLKAVGSSNTHTNLELNYSWQKPIAGFKIHYNFFLPNLSSATCLTTILNQGNLDNFTFSPTNQSYPLTGFGWLSGSNIWLAIAGAFGWGAMHALSPGHGKTIVGAYLAGAQATANHALILGLTTTITHTIGVFCLGLVALFAYQFVLPEQIYPWLNFISGLMVLAIGFNLFIARSQHIPFFRKFSQKLGWNKNPAIIVTHDHHSPDHNHSLNYEHDHGDGLYHSHALPDTSSVNMRSLLALGVSGGILPCPAALVLMLSAISLGQVSLGLGMVLAFSLGLAMVLTVLGLILVSAKRLFEKLPNQVTIFKGLPVFSAFCIGIIGLVISLQALLQIAGVTV